MTETQKKNIAWVLPRPKPDHYKGGMPLHCECWLIKLAHEVLDKPEATLLNLFCGMNKLGFRVDIIEKEVKPDLCCDAHEITKYLKATFDIILADPPYSDDEAMKLYGFQSIM